MILELLSQAVRAARAAGADDVEVSHLGRTLGMTRFANSAFTQAGVVVEQTTRVRVALGARVGSATTSGLDDPALAEAARQAIAAAEFSPPVADFTGFATPVPMPAVASRSFDAATAAYGPAERAALLGRMFAQAARHGLLCAGAFHTGPRRRAVVTAAGVALEHESTEAQLSCIALDGDASGYSVYAGHDLAGLDATAMAERASVDAVRARTASAIEPGIYDVVLAPPAVAELLDWLAIASFSARPFLDGTSLLTGRTGQLVCDERITIEDDPDGDVPFDAEGSLRRRVAPIERGRAGAPVSDRITAARLGSTSTGNALPIGTDFNEGPQAASLVLRPGADRLEELIGRVDRGLFVSRFHYVNGLLDTRQAVMTGMTRDGTFMIERGKLGPAVKNLRFTDSILAALGRVGGVGNELHSVPTLWTSAAPTRCPALLLRAFQFTGTSR